MVANRFFRQDEPPGDLGIGEPVGEKLKHLELACREPGRVGAACRPGTAGDRQAARAPVAQHGVADGGGVEPAENVQALLRVPHPGGECQRVCRPQGTAQSLPCLRGGAVVAGQHESEGLRHRGGDLPGVPGEVKPPVQLAEVPGPRVCDGGGPGTVDLGGDV